MLWKRGTRTIVATAAALVVGATAYAYTAANTVPSTAAGSGATAISGFAATNVDYVLNGTTPSNIDSVTFTLSPTSAAVVKIKLAAAGSFYDCTNTAGAVSCATTSPQATVAAATELTVLAVD